MGATRTIRRLCAAGLVLLAAGTVGAALAFLGWPFELFAHFRWQMGAAALALLALAVATRERRLIACAAVLLLVQPLPWLSNSGGLVVQAAVPTNTCTGPILGVATLNLYFQNRDRSAVFDWIEAHPVDVIALQEVTADWEKALEKTSRLYPYRRMLVRDDPYGIALLSRWPLHDVETVDFAGDGLPSLTATVEWKGRDVRVVALHTRWPVTRDLQQARDRALANAAVKAHSGTGMTVLLGDLNVTPYAPAFGRLVHESGLQDVFATRAWRPTWSESFWPLALPLDHVLASRDACVVTAGIGRDVGSDHRPVWAELRLAR